MRSPTTSARCCSSTPRTSPGLIAGGAHPSPVPVRRRRDVHHAQDAARPARRRDPVPAELRGGDRQGRVPRPAGRAADARDRGQGGRVPRGRAARRSASTPRTIVAQRAALAAALAGEGFRIVSGGTDNHLMLVDLRPFGVTGKVAQEALDRAGITCNKNAIPNDPEKPFVTSGLRLGTAVGHDGGHGPGRDARDRRRSWRACCARSTTNEVAQPRSATQANRLCSKFTPYPRRLRADSDRTRWRVTSLVSPSRSATTLLADAARAARSRSGSARWSRRPTPRHVHTKPTPTLGGAAMFVGFLAAMAVASQHAAVPRDVPATTPSRSGCSSARA